MSNFDSILSAATALSPPERVRLIDALWDTVPEDAESPFSEEWLAEIERRVDAYRSGKEATIPWPQVRDEALARIRRGQDH